MKKVIDGKLYNTETAILIHRDTSSSLSMSDFHYYDEGLYITKKGNYFLAGEGHAQTRWATSDRRSRSWGSGIIALNVNEALQWCEYAKVNPDIITEYFKIEEA